MKNYYQDLHNLCVWNIPEQIAEFLNEHQEDQLDVTYDEGDLFKTAALNSNYEVLQVLIAHYKQNFIERYKESKDYYLQKRAEQNLSETVQNVTDMGIKLPPSVQNLFAPYLIGQDSADSDHEQDDFSDDENSAQEFIQICENSNISFIGNSTERDTSKFISEEDTSNTALSGNCVSDM